MATSGDARWMRWGVLAALALQLAASAACGGVLDAPGDEATDEVAEALGAKGNLNVDAEAQLAQVRGLTPALAHAIVADRAQRGPFFVLSDVRRVPGVTAQVYSKARSGLTVGPSCAADADCGTGLACSLPSTGTSHRGVCVASRRPGVPAASVVHFDQSNPEVQAFAQAHGWNRSGQKVGVLSADLVYSTDGWHTTHTATLQYLWDNSRGFLLRDVPPGTPITYAVHAWIGVSHDNFYSYDARADVWANNGGRDYSGSTERNPAP